MHHFTLRVKNPFDVGLMNPPRGRSQGAVPCSWVRYGARSSCRHHQKNHKRTKIKSYPFPQRLAPQRQRHIIKSNAADLLWETLGLHVNSPGELKKKGSHFMLS